MAAPIVNGVYYIQNARSGTVVDLTDGSTGNDALVQGYYRRSLEDPWASAQMWIVVQIPGTTDYIIRNASGRTCIDLPDDNHAAGAQLVGFAEDIGKKSQHWSITRDVLQPSYYVIKNQDNNLYMDLKDGNGANGTPVQVWTSEGPTTNNQNQLWSFIGV